MPPEEKKVKNILRYKIRRRLSRQGRIVIDKVPVTGDEPQLDHAYDLLPKRKIVKLDDYGTGILNYFYEQCLIIAMKGLNVLYDQKYRKMEDIYPFADSDDDKELTEFAKAIKRTGFLFKNFQKQKRSSTVLAAE
mgnify:CR=1